jgi:hypothetical protein
MTGLSTRAMKSFDATQNSWGEASSFRLGPAGHRRDSFPYILLDACKVSDLSSRRCPLSNALSRGQSLGIQELVLLLISLPNEHPFFPTCGLLQCVIGRDLSL